MQIRMSGSCAARDNEAVLLLGPSGCGKSDLLLRLIDRGFALVADDQIRIDDEGASPPHGLEGLVEMRGLGILRLAFRAPVPLVLACTLTGRPVRLPAPARYTVGLRSLPLVALDPRSPSAPLLVSYALDCAAGRTGMHTGAFVA